MPFSSKIAYKNIGTKVSVKADRAAVDLEDLARSGMGRDDIGFGPGVDPEGGNSSAESSVTEDLADFDAATTTAL